MAIFTDTPPIAARDATTRLSFEQGRTIVWLAGEHDIASAWMVADTLARAIALDHADLVVDLSETEFIGSNTIAILSRAHTLLAERSRTLTVRAPSRGARRVIALVGADTLIDATLEADVPGRGLLQPA
jgi:anti-anti-sigma factor